MQIWFYRLYIRFLLWIESKLDRPPKTYVPLLGYVELPPAKKKTELKYIQGGKQ